jgi:hypothetical protein
MQGKLAKPDEWSFLTTNRVWMNQNWGTHLAYYWSNRLAGQTGLLLLKAAMIALMGLGVTLAARQRGARLGASVLVAGGVIIAARAYIDLRPNLTTLMMAPWMLYLLMRSRDRVHRIWLAVGFIALWANMHGGFNLGLGMLGLWAAYHGLAAWGASGEIQTAFKRYWPLAAATVAAIVLAGVATPFVVVKPYGLANLLHGFIVFKEPAWREVSEWRSIFEWRDQDYGSRWEFLTMLGLIVAASFANFQVWRHKRLTGQAPRLKPSAQAVAFTLFEVTLLLIVVYMACSSRRFMPAAMALAAPFLAVQLDSLLRLARRSWPLAAACLLLAIPTAYQGFRLTRYYRPDNPQFTRETFLERLVFAHQMMPLLPAEFINANNITGNVFEEWRWEGYLHWMCPQLKLYIGGRAQQVYSVQEYEEQRYLGGMPGEALRVFRQRDVHLVVMPWAEAAGTFLDDLVGKPDSTWAVLYFDGRNAILADYRYGPTRRLISAAMANQLKFPNEEVATLSRAACLSSICLRTQVSQADALAAVRQAVRQYDSHLMPTLLCNLSPNRQLADEDMRLLEQRFTELSNLPQPRPEGVSVLSTCKQLCVLLFDQYNAAGRLAQAQQWRLHAAEMDKRLEEMKQYWSL